MANKYVELLEKDPSKLQQLVGKINEYAKKYVDQNEDDWEFEITEEDVDGPNDEDELEKCIGNFGNNGGFDNFFGLNLTDEDVNKIVEYLNDHKTALDDAYNIISDAIEEAKQEFADNYEPYEDPTPRGEYAPWGGVDR